MAQNMQYKDAVFRHLFNDKKNILNLYAALSGNTTLTEADIDMATLDGVFDNGRRNDVAFTYGNNLVVMVEHQSTVNENMALRFFFYTAKYYENLMPKDVLYRKRRIKLPEPQYYVLYIGRDKEPEHRTMRLSEAMPEGKSEWLDLKVECYNINKSVNGAVLHKSDVLDGYSTFVDKVVRYKEMGMPLDESIRKAVDECIEEGILAEFLSENKKEVETMFNEEWDLGKACVVSREEGLAEGMEKGRIDFAVKMIKEHLPVDLIQRMTELSLSSLQMLSEQSGVALVM